MIFIKDFLEFLEDLLVFRNQEVKLLVQSGTLKKRPTVKFRNPLELSTVLILKYLRQMIKILFQSKAMPYNRCTGCNWSQF